MNDKPTVIDMPGKPDQFAAAVEHAKRQLAATIELQQHLAKVRRAAFLAYVAEGFNEAQALELCSK